MFYSFVLMFGLLVVIMILVVVSFLFFIFFIRVMIGVVFICLFRFF